MTPPMPTVAEYAERVSAATSDSTRRVYGRYWRALVDGYPDAGGTVAAYGDRPLSTIVPTDLEIGMRAAMTHGVRRSVSQGGQSAGEHYIAAARRLFASAVREGLLDASPAAQVAKPRRPPSPRQALSAEDVAELFRGAANGGNDPGLDVLLLRFHLETGARRGGAVDLTLADINAEAQMVRLREKFDRHRWQPVTTTLRDALLRHHAERSAGTAASDPVLRYRNGSPLTRRRYNTLFDRIGHAAATPVTAHVLRHTAITQVERVASYPVAARFAGHVLSRPTDTYIHVTDRDVAEAVMAIWRSTHPLVALDAPR